MLRSAQTGGGIRTETGLDMATEDALWTVARAYPNVPDALVDAARTAFAGQLDGSNARRRRSVLARRIEVLKRRTAAGDRTVAAEASDEGVNKQEWRTLTDDEIIGLAASLWALPGSLSMDAVPQLADTFGWIVLTTAPDRAMLDSGFGIASGKIRGRAGLIVEIDLRVTEFAYDDFAGRAKSRDAFAKMARALTSAIGEPTARFPGASAEIRWAGSQATLVLKDLRRSVRLALVTNSRLHLHDQAIELEEPEPR